MKQGPTSDNSSPVGLEKLPQLAEVAKKAALEKKAEDILLLGMEGRSSLCDYQMLCSAENENQSRAIAAAIEEFCFKELKQRPYAIEGKGGGHWIAMDYGSIIIHIFHKQLREHYNLERLWAPSAAK